jgi:hypothetical protein
MVIYNVTIKVEWAIAEDWLHWMKSIHLPEMLATGCFEKHQLVRLLQVDETEGPTYAVQYFAPTLMKYDEYLQRHAPDLRQKTIDKWGEKFIAFRTLMQMED